MRATFDVDRTHPNRKTWGMYPPPPPGTNPNQIVITGQQPLPQTPIPVTVKPTPNFTGQLVNPDAPVEPGQYLVKIFAPNDAAAAFLEWASKTLNAWDNVFAPAVVRWFALSKTNLRIVMPKSGTYFRIQFANKLQTMPRKWYDKQSRALMFVLEVRKA